MCFRLSQLKYKTKALQISRTHKRTCEDCLLSSDVEVALTFPERVSHFSVTSVPGFSEVSLWTLPHTLVAFDKCQVYSKKEVRVRGF